MNCVIDPDSLSCVRCGAVFRTVRTACACPMYPHRATGLGDMVAAGLEAVGITKELVSAAVGRDCGCAGRQEALNALGRRIGIG